MFNKQIPITGKKREREEDSCNEAIQLNEHPGEDDTFWEYMGEDGNIYGPYGTREIIAWKKEGYFQGDSAVEIRTVNIEQRRAREEQLKIEENAEMPSKKARTSEANSVNGQDSSDDDDDDESHGAWGNSDRIDFEDYI